MPIETELIENRRHCRISGVLGIFEAADTWRVLGPLLCAGEPLHIDLSGIEACDGAGIQILCQIQRAAEADSGDIHIDTISESLLADIRHAGMDAGALAHCAEEE